MNKSEKYEVGLIQPTVYWGRLLNLAACALSFLPGIYLWIFYNAVPPLSAILAASASIVIGFSGPLWFVEPMSFFPILGVPGSYMAMLSGNIANMRVPCSTMAQDAAGVQEGTEEGSIISTLGVGISIVINLIVMVLGVVAGAKIVALFPPIVAVAFQNYILPAVYGGVFAQFSLKGWKAGVVSFVATTLICYFFSFPSYVVMPLSIIIAIAAGIKFDRKKHEGETNDKSEGIL